MKNKLKLNIFLVTLLFIVLFNSISIADAERYTYLNRHFFEDGSYELRPLIVDKDLSLNTRSSPYLIEDIIIVRNGAKLTIQDGVNFIFDNFPQGDNRFDGSFNSKDIDKRIIVDGDSSLEILGTEKNPVHFKSVKFLNNKSTQGWGTIFFEEGSSGYMEFVNFYDGGFFTMNENGPSIEIKSKDVYINNCFFKNSIQYDDINDQSFYNAITIDKLYDSSHTVSNGPKISNCMFDINSPYIIHQRDINDNPIYSNLKSNNYKKDSVIYIDSKHHQKGSDLIKNITLENVGVPYLIDGTVNIHGSLKIKDSIVLFSNENMDNNLIKPSSLIVNTNARLDIDNTTLDSYVSSWSSKGWGNIEFMEDSIGHISDSKIKNAGSQYIRISKSKDNFFEEINPVDISSVLIKSSLINITNTSIIDSYSSGLMLASENIQPELHNLIVNNSRKYAIRLVENAKPKFSGYINYKKNFIDGIFLDFPHLNGDNFWTNIESPYYLNRIYTLKENDSLTIDEGTNVLFDGNETGLIFYDNSSIKAIGSDKNKIYFDSYGNTDKYWGSISLLDNSSGILKYCNFHNGGDNNFLSKNHSLNKNQNPHYYGIINSFNNNLTLEYSNFNNLKNNALYLDYNSYPNSIENNFFNTSVYSENPILINSFGIYKYNNDIWNSSSKVYGKYNWWNHDTGPYNSFNNPSGKGTMVSHNIVFENHLKNIYDNANYTNRIVYIDNPDNEIIPIFHRYKSFSINFNKSLDENYINNSFIGVKNNQDQYVPVNVHLNPNNSRQVIISPVGYYSPGKYTIVLKDGIKSAEGNLEINNRIISKFKIE